MDHFLDFFFFGTILEGGGRVEHTIITEGGVGGRVLLLREGCETYYYYKGRGGRGVMVNTTG